MNGGDLRILSGAVPELRKLNRRCGPVFSTLLADLLGVNDRTMRYWLRKLEQAGLVERPYGPRSGWMVRV